MKDGYENQLICQKCEGKCCKFLPGIALPKDFNNGDLDTLVIALGTGKWAIDWYDGDPTDGDRDRAYFIRPSIKGRIRLYDPAWGWDGECIFLTKKGCSLLFDLRPTTCRMLEPKEGQESCDDHGFDKKKCSIEWLPFTDVIEKAAKIVSNNKGGKP